ncbi:hypothetical protein [Halobacillus sp. H74]|uniref:hypothetical protein n=1 Tax=Halobacillus sp. H74 TaxID=3457436 RepID=UPI003FCEA730
MANTPTISISASFRFQVVRPGHPSHCQTATTTFAVRDLNPRVFTHAEHTTKYNYPSDC